MIRLTASILFLSLAACAPIRNDPASRDGVEDFGVLVMAHGGPPEWNRSILAAVKPLSERNNIEVAFGMADAASLQEGISRLEAHGARRIGVVRLFVSGESWYERTEQILGLRNGAPERPVDHASHAGHHGGGHEMAFWRVRARASFALSKQGLVEAEETAAILAERTKALSRRPELEDVLILAHGPGDDAENERWLAHLLQRAAAVRASAPYRRVHVETLREDWPEKRKEAEQRVRAFVTRASETGGKAIVIPFRVQGFGPYARVLQGLDYTSDGVGLLPHPGMTEWIDRQIRALRDGPFRSAGNPP